MLQRRYRFQGRSSLRYLFAKGRTVRNRSFALRFVANSRRTDSRCTVVVSRKVLKAAPKRNRVRRRIYEIIRNHWDHIAPSHDMLITVYDPAIFDAPHEQVKSGIVDLLVSAKLWRNKLSGLERLPKSSDTSDSFRNSSGMLL